jgi:hypothetical protein
LVRLTQRKLQKLEAVDYHLSLATIADYLNSFHKRVVNIKIKPALTPAQSVTAL